MQDSSTQIDFSEANRPLDKRLLRYVWRHTRREQIWILFVIIASMPTYFMALELPIRIINEGIQGEGFEEVGSTRDFLRLSIGVPDFLGGASVVLFGGFPLERLGYLFALANTFLVLVCVNGLFKFYINTYKGRLGERMLRRMRYSLVDRVLRFPINHFRRVKGSEIASMVKDEIEPFGEFIGDAFVQPVYLGGQALVAFIFILTQSFWLGMIAVIIIIFQVNLIPYLRRRVLVLGRMRQLTARLLSGRIGEIVESIISVHVNDTSNYERAELSSRLGKIFFIRYELYQRKFFIKFINNFLAQLTPYIFYVVGGYLAIRGSLSVGQLVGVINAYKDLPSPINGLIQWDQRRTDINIKYAQIVEQFNVGDMLDAEQQEANLESVAPLQGDLLVSNLTVDDDTGTVLVEDAEFTLPIRGITAALGPLGSGAGAIANTVAGLFVAKSGRMVLNDQPLTDLPQSVRGRRFAYAGSENYLPQSTLLDSLLYVTKHAPLRTRMIDELLESPHPRSEVEAIAAGNTLLDYHADWVDYDSMGVNGPNEVYDKVREVLEIVELDSHVYQLAMRQFLNPSTDEELCNKLLEVRRAFESQIRDSSLSDSIEVFRWDSYSEHATIAENLLFGAVIEGESLSLDNLAANSHMRSVLSHDGLDRDLFAMGIELAETAIELFADLTPDNPFFEQLNFMTPEQLTAYPPILSRVRRDGFDGVEESDRVMLIQLPFGYIEPRNRLRLLDSDLRSRILSARHRFHATLPSDMSDVISTYNESLYNPYNSVRDNILFGHVAHGAMNADEQIQTIISDLLVQFDLEESIFRVGLSFDIGSGGKRLSENQRQRIILARALLKGADLLIVNRALNTLEPSSQERIVKRILSLARGEGSFSSFGVLWVLTEPQFVEMFDNVLLFSKQRLVSTGSPSELRGTDSYDRLLSPSSN